MSKLLEDDDYNAIVKVFRIGRLGGCTGKSRPIRVEFRETEDRDWVLRNAYRLVKNKPKLKLSIRKCLNNTKMLKHLRDVRNDCARLNNSTSKCVDGRDKYVVINGRIMERTQAGKLIRHWIHDGDSATKSTSAVNEKVDGEDPKKSGIT